MTDAGDLDLDPKTLAAEATGGDAGDAAADAADAADAGEAADAGTSAVDLLLATEPDEDPADYPDETPEWLAHYLIGAKKVLAELTGADVDAGTPAAANFMFGTVGLLRSRQADAGAGGEAPDPDDGPPRGAGGREEWGDV
jgi:hypothetical protein